MLRIPCPWCGLRDQSEFYCGGEAAIERPDEPAAATDAQWADYLFYRNNPKGMHFERWEHTWGCRQWFNLVRDTVTHEIHGSFPIGSRPPDWPASDTADATPASPQ